MWLKPFMKIRSVVRLTLFFSKSIKGIWSMSIEEIAKVLEKIEREDCLNEEETFASLEGYLQEIISVYMALIGDLPEYKKMGIDLPEEVILQQVKNLDEAVQYHDLIKLYDTLKYEVQDTFNLYKEIKIEMRK